MSKLEAQTLVCVPTMNYGLSTRTQTKVYATPPVEASRNNGMAFIVRSHGAKDGRVVSELRKKR